MPIPVVLGFDDIVPSKGFLQLIEKYRPLGVIVFERNIGNTDKLAHNIRMVKSAWRDVLVMIDEEGGAKSRIRAEHGFPNPPDPRIVAHDMSLPETEEAYYVLGRALRKFGIDVDLAPVVDVAPPGHILGDRAFSDNPDICAKYGSAVIKGLRRAGIMSCAKHFPGLGSAAIDPHLSISIADSDANFSKIHFPPFEAAISAGVDFLMTTHLRAVQLDSSGSIATFSVVITEKIRELAFSGKILTDDMLMGGVDSHDTLDKRCITALAAGHDAVLICKEVDRIEVILDAIAEYYPNKA